MRKAVVLVVFVGVFVGGTCVVHGDTIYACVHNTNGKVRIVDSPGMCNNSEYDLSWGEGNDLEQAVNSLIARIENVETMLGVFNDPPVVDCGEDRVTLMSDPLTLSPTATDDGVKQPLTFAWSVLDGPEGEFSSAIFFPDQFSQTVEAWFPGPGVYELQFSAFDGFVTVSDSVLVTVAPENLVPSIVVDMVHPIVDMDGEGGPFQCASNVYFTILDDGFPTPATADGLIESARIVPLDAPYSWGIPPYIEEIIEVGGSAGERDFRAITNSYVVPVGTGYLNYVSYDLVIFANDGTGQASETVSIVCVIDP